MKQLEGECVWTMHHDRLPTINYECFKCGERTEGFSVCLKCNPQIYEVIGDLIEKCNITMDLKLEDNYGRLLHVTTFAGIVAITPHIKMIGDTIALNNEQSRMLMEYLQEHLK